MNNRWKAANREKVREQERTRRSADPEKAREACRRWRERKKAEAAARKQQDS